MKQGRLTILLLTALYVLSEIVFFYLLAGSFGEFFEFFGKTFLCLLLILLFTMRFSWAKWTLSVLLILLGVLYLNEAIEDGTTPLYIIGAFNIFFGVYIHISKSLKVFRSESQSVEESLSVELGASPNTQMAEINYPTLVRRYKALLIDGLLCFGTLIVLMLVVQDSEYRRTIMITTATILLLCYEPLLTVYSGTIGQRVMKIKVRRFRQPDTRLTLVKSYVRWLTKGLLGWVSFITINFNREHRAIHDFASDSIMLQDSE